MNNILIKGGAGFIGSNFAIKILGFEPKCLFSYGIGEFLIGLINMMFMKLNNEVHYLITI